VKSGRPVSEPVGSSNPGSDSHPAILGDARRAWSWLPKKGYFMIPMVKTLEKCSQLSAIEREVSELCDFFLTEKDRIRVLEAGCGSGIHVEFKPIVDLAGIDISEDQLARNSVIQEKILGDIHDYPLPKEQFDVVVCWWVLEHLSRPRNALVNLFGSVRPGGLLILTFPNLLSFKGLVTKFTPFWFHKLVYRFMKIDGHPFPTCLRVAILPKNVIRFAQERGFSVVYFRLSEGNTTRKIRTACWLAGRAFAVANSALQTISFGKLDSFMLDYCVMVLRKGNGTQECGLAGILPLEPAKGQPLARAG
jgi:SAM-dependent methyltransferase